MDWSKFVQDAIGLEQSIAAAFKGDWSKDNLVKAWGYEIDIQQQLKDNLFGPMQSASCPNKDEAKAAVGRLGNLLAAAPHHQPTATADQTHGIDWTKVIAIAKVLLPILESLLIGA
jgi:hypothetical protein